MYQSYSVLSGFYAALLGISSLLFVPASAKEKADSENVERTAMLLFGDAGYHLDYPDEDDAVNVAKTRSEYEARYKAEWLEDHKPLSEFKLPALSFDQKLGGYVMASGMRPVADAMYQWCQKRACHFALMAGDNIYPDGATEGADGNDDQARFRKVFTEPYDHYRTLNEAFKIYVTLGNHDWHTSRAGAMAQVAFHEASDLFYMNSPIYQVRAAKDVEIFVIDTEVLLASTTVMKDKLDAQGHEVQSNKVEAPDPWTRPQTGREKKMLQWLKAAMEASDARWKIVLGHHPIWSSGGSKFEQARSLRKLLLPILCDQADLYVSGHDHSVEVHEQACPGRDPLLQVVSGAAGKQRGLNHAFIQYQNEHYFDHKALFAAGMVWGFGYLELVGDQAMLQLVTLDPEEGANPTLSYQYRFTKRH